MTDTPPFQFDESGQDIRLTLPISLSKAVLRGPVQMHIPLPPLRWRQRTAGEEIQ